MSEWMLELRGHVFDLKSLSDLFTMPDCLVIEEGGDYRLKSTAFDALANDAEVYEKAKALMPEINGAAGIYHQGYRNVQLSGGVISVSDDGTRKRYIYEAVTDTLRLTDSADVSGGVAVSKGPTPADGAMK